MSFLPMSFVKLHYKLINDISNKKFLFALRFASFSHISLRADWIMRPCWLKVALKMFYLKLLLKAHLLKSIYQFGFFFVFVFLQISTFVSSFGSFSYSEHVVEVLEKSTKLHASRKCHGKIYIYIYMYVISNT